MTGEHGRCGLGAVISATRMTTTRPIRLGRLISVTKAATQVLITSDMADDAKYLEFGDSLTVTFQVANTDGDPVAIWRIWP